MSCAGFFYSICSDAVSGHKRYFTRSLLRNLDNGIVQPPPPKKLRQTTTMVTEQEQAFNAKSRTSNKTKQRQPKQTKSKSKSKSKVKSQSKSKLKSLSKSLAPQSLQASQSTQLQQSPLQSPKPSETEQHDDLNINVDTVIEIEELKFQDDYNFGAEWTTAISKFNTKVDKVLQVTNQSNILLKTYLYSIFVCVFLNICEAIAKRFSGFNYSIPPWLVDWLLDFIVDVMWYVYLLFEYFDQSVLDLIFSNLSGCIL